jgi:hypothetical protein
MYNPWEQVYNVTGTNGMQFHPKLIDKYIYTFSPDYARPLWFQQGSRTKAFPGYSAFQYNFDVKSFKSNSGAYNIYLNGTSNLTTVMQTPAFACMGNYQGVAREICDA